MIYSPACPVIRDDSGNWLAQPAIVDIITSPAPNAGVVMHAEPANRARITPTLIERTSKVLALALAHGCDALVLGAWGCGVFQNDPTMVAAAFHTHLASGGKYAGRFRHVLFAISDSTPAKATLNAFVHQFADLT